ncbi:MAG: sarcosine oxidase subunit gamma [Geminicoccaceae bacterium]|nr:sarcosine oxidase subunit gamma [Geminicoccaceae bacterium]
MAEPVFRSALADAPRPQAANAGLRLSDRSGLAVLDLRGGDPVARSAGGAFGHGLPTDMNRMTGEGASLALKLGPDEWLLLGGEGEGPAMLAGLDGAFGDEPHALVDLSMRFAAIEVEGPARRDVLAAACPVDLHPERAAAGFATRTVFGKADVVLAFKANSILILVNRSFAPYVWGLLVEAGREFGVAA